MRRLMAATTTKRQREFESEIDMTNVVKFVKDDGLDFKRNNHRAVIKDDAFNIALAMKKLGISIKYNEFSDEIEIAGLHGYGPILNERGTIRLHFLIRETFKFLPPTQLFERALTDIASTGKFHPLRELINALVWHGVARIDTCLNYGNS